MNLNKKIFFGKNIIKDPEDYYVVLNSEKDRDIFENEMQEKDGKNFIPQRSCKNMSNSVNYFKFKLTNSEAEKLKSDPRVKKIEKKVPYEIKPLGFVSNKNILKPIDFSKKEETKDSTVIIQALNQTATILNIPDARDIDVVIVDGHIDPNHPEFAKNSDGSGGTRVNQINWFDFIGREETYEYTPYINQENQDETAANDHGCHVAGIAAGNKNGWAKQANIYNISPYHIRMYDPDTGKDPFIQAIKNWHIGKPINQKRGTKNPTITNHSYGYVYPWLIEIRDILEVNYRGNNYTSPRNYSGAAMSCNVANGNITSINIDSQGSNYTNEPTISFYGGGQIEATAEMASGSIKSITVTERGSGYLTAPTISFSPPEQQGGVTPVATAIIDINQGSITDIEFVELGSGYTNPPSITFTPPPQGTAAEAVVEIGSNFIKKINITNGGTDYTDYPYMILSGGSPTIAASWGIDSDPFNPPASIENGSYVILTAIEILGDGFKKRVLGGQYSSAPTVSFYGGNFPESGSTNKVEARCELGTGENEGKIVGVTVTAPGVNYTSPPNVVITNGGGFNLSELQDFGFIVYIADDNRYYLADIPTRNIEADADIEDLISSGVIVVAAAGNDYYRIANEGEQDYNNYFVFSREGTIESEPSLTDELFQPDFLYMHRGSSPGSQKDAICVGSVRNGNPEYKSPWSSTGPRIDIYSAGEKIISSVHTGTIQDPRNNNYYLEKYSGTSMASPQVAGMIACYSKENRNINQSIAKNFIKNNGQPDLQENNTILYNLQGGTNKVAYFPNIDTVLGSSSRISPTATAPGQPGAITGVPGAGQVTLNWKAPTSNGGSPITDYIVEYKINGTPDTSYQRFIDDVKSTPSCVVTGLANGTAYLFRIRAVNAINQGAPRVSTAITPRTVPSQISSVSVSKGDKKVTLSWAAPNNGGSNITNYIVQRKLSSQPDSSYTQIATVKTLTATAINLTNGSSYNFRVAAKNVAGIGAYSPNSANVIPAGVPLKPNAPTGVGLDSSINLTWSAPFNNGDDITDYVIQRRLSSQKDSNFVTIADGISNLTNFLATGLVNNTPYVFRIAAKNSIGQGVYSANSVAIKPFGPPSSPTGLSGSYSSGNINLKWTAPSNNGGSPITGYLIESKLSNQPDTSFTTEKQIGVATSTSIIKDISQPGPYTFRVKATNSTSAIVVYGAASAPSNPVSTPPGKCSNVYARPTDSGQITITWNAPNNDGGATVTDYIVQSLENCSLCAWITIQDGISNETKLIVNGFNNSSSYSFNVIAKNSNGAGVRADLDSSFIRINDYTNYNRSSEINSSHKNWGLLRCAIQNNLSEWGG